MTPRPRWLFGVPAAAWLAVFAMACSDEPRSMQPKDAGDDADSGKEDDAGGVRPICKDAPDGFACGDERVCLADKCVQSRCGDGVRAGAEECDDGNQRIDDDCTPSCRIIPGVCGDARLGLGEECDDGNAIDDDSCSNLCRAKVAQMDGGVDGGAGPTVTDGCPRLDGPLLVTPYVGEDERLFGRAFRIGARITLMPSYLRWSHSQGFGTVYTAKKDPLTISFVCTTTAAEQDAVIYFSGAYPYCTPLATEVTVTCGPPPPIPQGSGGTGGSGGIGGSDDTDGGSEDDSGSGGSGGSGGPYSFDQLSAECRQCAAENYTFDIAGEDVYGKCFGTVETPAFSQACIDAFMCSTLADDGAPGRGDDCGQNDINGAITCYCGQPYIEANCTNDAIGPHGKCQEAWEVAAGCEDITDVSDRANCVLSNFPAFTSPAGIASYAIVLQQGACAIPCLTDYHP